MTRDKSGNVIVENWYLILTKKKKDISHLGCINSSEYPSPQAFSAQSFLDSTVSCDVTGILAENAFSRPLSTRVCADNGSRENA